MSCQPFSHIQKLSRCLEQSICHMCASAEALETCAATAMTAADAEKAITSEISEDPGSDWGRAQHYDDRAIYLYVTMAFLAVLAGYVCTSYIFLRTPRFIFKRKERRFHARHISHRGGAGEATENTIEAYERALLCGTQLLELDVHLTKDNQVVAVHDQNLKRLAGVDGNVGDFHYDELPSLNRRIEVTFTRGLWNDDHESRKIPLLKDVFERFPDVPVNVDIKVDDDRLITETAKLITEYKREKLTVWGNAAKVVTDKCYKTNPDVGLLFSARRVILVVLMYYCGLLPFIPLKETHLEIPMPTCFYNLIPDTSKRARFMVSLMDKALMRRSLFEHLQKRGIAVYLWVLNEPGEWDRAFNQLGVDGVMTDYPAKLALYLQERDAKAAPVADSAKSADK